MIEKNDILRKERQEITEKLTESELECNNQKQQIKELQEELDKTKKENEILQEQMETLKINNEIPQSVNNSTPQPIITPTIPEVTATQQPTTITPTVPEVTVTPQKPEPKIVEIVTKPEVAKPQQVVDTVMEDTKDNSDFRARMKRSRQEFEMESLRLKREYEMGMLKQLRQSIANLQELTNVTTSALEDTIHQIDHITSTP